MVKIRRDPETAREAREGTRLTPQEEIGGLYEAQQPDSERTEELSGDAYTYTPPTDPDAPVQLFKDAHGLPEAQRDTNRRNIAKIRETLQNGGDLSAIVFESLNEEAGNEGYE